MKPKEIWQKFNDYKDENGYYFLGVFDECSETNTFDWDYYPPDDFKILIYLPNEDCMICSQQTYDRFAFHTYYTVEIDKDKILLKGSEGKEAEEWHRWDGYIHPGSTGYNGAYITGDQITITYDAGHEVTSFLFRVIFTILVELGVAWFFGFRTKNQMSIIALTNIGTQSILNILLNVMSLQQGVMAHRLYYFALECLVFAIEGFIYQRLLTPDNYKAGNYGTVVKTKTWMYAFVANVASFVLGLFVALIIPSMF